MAPSAISTRVWMGLRPVSPSRVVIAVAGFGACVLLVALRPEFAAPAIVLAGVLAAQAFGSAVLLPLLVAAAFVTRFRIEFAGHNFLVENLVVLSLWTALILEGKGRALARAAEDRTVVLLGCFVVWEGVVSMFRAPDVAHSLSIVGWLSLDWLLLVAVAAAFRNGRQLERLAVGSSTALAAVATVLWLAFLLAGSTLGTQGGGTYGDGARAVFALSWEANILASTVAVWAFVGISSEDPSVRRIASLGAPLAAAAIASSLTRAVIVGVVAGLVVWIILDGRSAMKRAGRLAIAIAALALVLVTLIPQATGPLQARFDELASFGQGSGALRVDAAETAIRDLDGASVVTGLGVDSFGQRHNNPALPGEPWYLGILPLQVLYESGVIGVVILGMAVASLRPLVRSKRGRALGVLTVYLVAASATSPFWFGWTWILIALAIMTRPDESSGGTKSTSMASIAAR